MKDQHEQAGEPPAEASDARIEWGADRRLPPPPMLFLDDHDRPEFPAKARVARVAHVKPNEMTATQIEIIMDWVDEGLSGPVPFHGDPAELLRRLEAARAGDLPSMTAEGREPRA